jgi:hypothetical protein
MASRAVALLLALVALLLAPASARVGGCRTVCVDPGRQGVGAKVCRTRCTFVFFASAPERV